MTGSFEQLFNPRGIAVVGASSDGGRLSGQTVPALLKFGYKGGIYPVNPKYDSLFGVKCFKSLVDIDRDCDVAVVAVSGSQVPGIIEQCGRKGIRFAVVLAGGFREAGPEGAALEQDMVAKARLHGVRIIGPNCVGLLSIPTNAVAAFGTLTRPPVLQLGGVSAVVQSGGFGLSLIIRCALQGIGFRHVVASGNEADITATELISAYVDDPDTRMILAYVEGIPNGREFMEVARRALIARKPLVVFKSGNTEEGKRAAASHTANMTGSYDVYKAAFKQCGIIEVQDVDEAADILLCLNNARLPKGRGVAIMGGSGGSAAVFSDAASEMNLALPPLMAKTISVLKEAFPAIGSYQNPIDYTAGYPKANDGGSYQRAVEAVLADPNVHQLAMMYTTLERNRLQQAAQLVADAAASSDKPVIIFTVMPDEIAPEGRETFRKANLPVFPSPKRIAKAMGLLAAYSECLSAQAKADVGIEKVYQFPEQVKRSADHTLSEYDSKRVLGALGIPVTQDVLLPADGVKSVPGGIQFPVAVKVVSADIKHKTDVGAVRLNVGNPEQLIEEAVRVVANARKAVPDAKIDGVLVSPMIVDGLETIVGVVNDESFGPVVLLGMGGIFAEVMKDTTYRIAPFGIEEANAMIGELRSKAVFDGARGEPPCDKTALAEVLAAVSQIAWRFRDRIAELDINPLLVRPMAQGCIAVDAVMTLRAR